MKKCEESLSESIESHIFERLKTTSTNSKSNLSGTETVFQGTVNKSNNFNSQLQSILILLGKPTNIPRLDALYRENLTKKLGFVPSFSMQIVNDSIKKLHETNKYTIYSTITENQQVEVVLKAPFRSILRQAQFIMIVSILLVIMIGIILVIQLRSMLRENRFVSFIKDYTHALTHELKTPISGIYMSSSQLASGKLEDKPESRQMHYKICQDQSSKLLKTVERILLVAKAEHSAIIPNKEYIDMKPFIEKIAGSFQQNNFRQKQLDISTNIGSDDIKGYIDPFLIENVISNLIDNAVKYSNTAVNIVVSCRLLNEKLLLSVKDNGFGIAEKELKHIFDNFERGDKVEQKGIDGFGIGLNYVNKVIKAHRGLIEVKSKEGQGSEFIIELPNK